MPAYVKCVRMMGGLNDKEISETYVKVSSSFCCLKFCVLVLRENLIVSVLLFCS